MESKPKKNPAPAKLYVFDSTKLLPGDIVLEMGAGIRSKAIAAAVGGDYSHALIWVGGTDFIEVVRQGTRVISFARVVVARPDSWMVLRFPDRRIASNAALEARQIAHKGYNLKGL